MQGTRWVLSTMLVLFAVVASLPAVPVLAQLTEEGRKRLENPGALEHIDGQLVSKKDTEPVPGAELLLYVVDRSKLTQELVDGGESDMSGNFSFGNLTQYQTAGHQRYFVLAIRHDEFASKIIKPSSSIEWLNDPDNWNIKLSSPETLTGRVVDDQGNPVAGALVWRHHFLVEPLEQFSAETDMNGEFKLTHLHSFEPISRDLPGGGRTVQPFTLMKLTHEELGSQRLNVPKIPGEINVVLPRPFVVKGQVVDDEGQPQADVVISATPHSSSLREVASYETTRTDENGNYRMTLSPEVAYNVWTMHSEKGAPAVEVSGGIGQTSDLPAIKLEPLVAVQGVVLNAETGDPFDTRETPLRVMWHGPDRPKTTAAVRGLQVTRDGTFTALMVPGENFPYVSTVDQNNVRWTAKDYQKNGVTIKRDAEPPRLELNVSGQSR